MKRLVLWSVVGLACGLTISATALFTAMITEGLPHSEDEAAYLFQAQVFAQNRLTVPTPPVDAAFFSPFVIDYNGQRFGKYPPGWPLLLSAGVRLGQPWLVNALLSTATIAMVTLLSRLVYCPAATNSANDCYLPVLVAGLMLTSPAFLFQSGLLLSHAAALFWITAALLGLVAIERGQPWAVVWVGLCLGAAFVTRPLAALGSGLVIVLYAGYVSGWRALAGIVIAAFPVALLLPLYWWKITGLPALNAYPMVWPYDRPGFGPDIGPHGYTVHDAIFINLRLKLETVANGLFGWPGWSNLVFIGVTAALLLWQFGHHVGGRLFTPGGSIESAEQPPRFLSWDWLLFGLVAAPVGLHIFYWAYGGADGGLPRYYYEALPAFVLLTARGVQLSSRWLAQWQHHLIWLPGLVVLLLMISSVVWRLPPQLATQQEKYGINTTPLQVVNQAQPTLRPPLLILVQDVETWADFAAPFAANQPDLTGPVVYAIDWNSSYRHALRTAFPERTCFLLAQNALTPCP
jgi:hypothetical protein